MLFQNYGVTFLGFSFLFYFPLFKIKQVVTSTFPKLIFSPLKSESHRQVGTHMKNTGLHIPLFWRRAEGCVSPEGSIASTRDSHNPPTYFLEPPCPYRLCLDPFIRTFYPTHGCIWGPSEVTLIIIRIQYSLHLVSF